MSETDDSLISELGGDAAGSESEKSSDDRAARRRKRRRVLIPLTVLGSLVLVVALIAGAYGLMVLRALDAMPRSTDLMPNSQTTPRPEPVPAAEGSANPPLNIVLMGSDSRGAGDQGRSDVLMLLHVSGDREDAYLISIPRDSWVEIPGHGTAKINAAYAYGGPALTVQTLETLLDVPIDHTVLIDFWGFKDVIDALGGVTVYNRIASGSDGYSFPTGPVDLTGDSALVYVRERYALPAGDFDRAARQRDVILAIIDKLTSRGVLADINKLQEVLNSVALFVTVDGDFSSMEIISQALGMRIDGSDDVRSLMIPVEGTGTSADGQSTVVLDEAGVERMARALRSDTMNEFAGGS